MTLKRSPREITVELDAQHAEELATDGRSVQEGVHRAIRLYRVMDNPDELLADVDLTEAKEE
jgi:hypothetical protein